MENNKYEGKIGGGMSWGGMSWACEILNDLVSPKIIIVDPAQEYKSKDEGNMDGLL